MTGTAAAARSTRSGPTGAGCSPPANGLAHHGLPRCGTPASTSNPTGQILGAWIAKEELRALLATAKRGGHRHEIRDAKYRFLTWCAQFSEVPEITTLVETVDTWWTEIEAFCRLNVTNARTEGSNRSLGSNGQRDTGLTWGEGS
ncbi:MAG: transposase [Actinomycetota bacterium]|nr:transposase [Actinomycetota bacterium]